MNIWICNRGMQIDCYVYYGRMVCGSIQLKPNAHKNHKLIVLTRTKNLIFSKNSETFKVMNYKILGDRQLFTVEFLKS